MTPTNANISPRFSVTVADNGWIVRVLFDPPRPQPPGPERKQPRLLVFDDWHKLYEWQLKFCGPKEVRE